MKKKNGLLLLSCLGFLLLVGFQSKRGAVDKVPATKGELGEKLFFDPILSKDRRISCASCHKPEFAFADNVPFSFGVDSLPGDRNTPSVMNSAGRIHLFWDGRANSLAEQALFPIANPKEMNLPIAEAVERLNADEVYAQVFRKLFKSKATTQNLGEALAEYEKTLESSSSPYDRYLDGDDQAMNPAAIRGRLLFIGKANCANCHTGDDFTADRFKSIGLYNGQELNDSGRFAITNDSTQLGLFKVPGLRNVALTAPYMHNGQFKTLQEVIRYYNKPDDIVANSLNRDLSLSQPLGLTEQEMDDLEAFLQALTDDRFRKSKE